MLAAAVGQGRVVIGVPRDGLGRRCGQGHADAAGLVEGDGIAVDDAEGRDRVAAAVAFHRIGADPLDMGFGPDGVADRAARGDIGIAQAEPLGRAVVARCRGGRGHGDVADADRHPVAHLGAGDADGRRDLVPAAQAGRDHRTPAAGRGIGDDGAAVLDGAKHGCRGVEDTVGKLGDDDAAARRRDAAIRHGKPPMFTVKTGGRLAPWPAQASLANGLMAGRPSHPCAAAPDPAQARCARSHNAP